MKFNDYPELINHHKQYTKIDWALTETGVPKKTDDKEVLLAYTDATETGLEHIIKTKLVDLIHPVGSVILTTSTSFDPAAQFGGTWVQWTDGYLKVDRTPNSTVQGATEYKIDEEMLPRHTHNMDHNHTYNQNNDPYFVISGTDETARTVVKGVSGASDNIPSVDISTTTDYDQSYTVTMSNDDPNGSAGSLNQKVSISFDHTHTFTGSTRDGGFANKAYKPGYYAVIAWQRTA